MTGLKNFSTFLTFLIKILMIGAGCRVQFYTLQVFVHNNDLYINYLHIYVRFSELVNLDL